MGENPHEAKRGISRLIKTMAVIVLVMGAIAFVDWIILQFIIYTTPPQ